MENFIFCAVFTYLKTTIETNKFSPQANYAIDRCSQRLLFIMYNICLALIHFE